VNKRPVWIAALVVFLFATVLFPFRTEWLNRGLDGVFIAPDGMASYDARVLAESFSVLAGEKQPLRIAYARTEWTLDLVFPFAYVTFFALLLLAIHPGAPEGRLGRAWRWLAVGVPVAAGLADLAENFYLAKIARTGWWELLPGKVEEIARHIADDARRAAFATSAKQLFLSAVLPLLVIALLRSGRLGRLVTLLWLGRIPVVALGSLLAFASLGGADRVSPTIPNMLVLEHWGQVFAVGYLASAVAILAGFSLLLIWELAPQRLGARLPTPPPLLSSRRSADPLRNSVFLFFAIPLVFRAVVRSRFQGAGLAGHAPAALFGIAGAVATLWLVKILQRLMIRLPAATFQRGFAALARRLGRGYENPATGGFLEGHGLAAALAGVMTLAYVLGQWFLDPGRFPDRTFAVPTAGYLLGAVAILGSLLAGATFFFDRWRVPIVAIAVGWVVLLNSVRPIEHEFEWNWNAKPVAAANRAAESRLAQGPPRVLTVVTASGGGIQAAAWTARVLTGLQDQLGAGFTRSIALVSSVSGGSVGTYFALSAFADQGADQGAMRSDELDAVFEASAESSLEPTAWGLLYPDLLRGLVPGVRSTRDRGWAMERGWLRARRLHGLDPTSARQSFSSWVSAAASGELPAVIFNATRIEDGMPLRLATVGRRDLTVAGSGGGNEDAPLVGLAPDFNYRYEHGQRRDRQVPGYLMLPSVTAARLSATFPYVSPIARPERDRHDRWPLRLWHAADGGYFDNHGTVAALAWLYELQRAWGTDLSSHLDRLVWIQIDAFPESDLTDPDHAPGWTMSAIGPLEGLLNVRVASQRVRRAAEVTIEQQLQGGLLKVVILRPPARTGPHRDAPLSWELSREDVERMRGEWAAIAKGRDLDDLRVIFGAAAPAQ